MSAINPKKKTWNAIKKRTRVNPPKLFCKIRSLTPLNTPSKPKNKAKGIKNLKGLKYIVNLNINDKNRNVSFIGCIEEEPDL